MTRFLKTHLFSVLNSKNLWAADIPLFLVLALEALRPGIVIYTLNDSRLLPITLLFLELIWIGRLILLWIQKKIFSGYLELGLNSVSITIVFLLGILVVVLGRLNLGEFLPLLFLFTSAFAVIYQKSDSGIYKRLIPMTATALGFVLAYLRPAHINPIPVMACLFAGASHWFIIKDKNPDNSTVPLRVYFLTTLAFLAARLIYRN